jgi:hypothetical protein
MALGGADWAVAWPAALCTDAPHASAAASLARPTRAGVGGWRALAVLLGVRLRPVRASWRRNYGAGIESGTS